MDPAPLILISNDDGIDAPGILALAAAAAPLGEVWVVAPDREQSARSHAARRSYGRSFLPRRPSVRHQARTASACPPWASRVS